MALLDVQDLAVSFVTRNGTNKAVDGVSFSVELGKITAIIGESGSGKSVACYSLLGLVPMPPGRIDGGRALFEDRDLLSAAVVDADAHLLGRITVGDVVDVIRDEADRTLMQSAGLDQEEDLFAPVVPSARRRGLWLGNNLITVFLAAWVIGRFEAALEQIVALAVHMPVVASMPRAAMAMP